MSISQKKDFFTVKFKEITEEKASKEHSSADSRDDIEIKLSKIPDLLPIPVIKE